MNRRNFLKLIGFGGAAAALAPTLLFAKLPAESLPDDVMHPRYGAWTVRRQVKGMLFECECICGKVAVLHADFILDNAAVPRCGHEAGAKFSAFMKRASETPSDTR